MDVDHEWSEDAGAGGALAAGAEPPAWSWSTAARDSGVNAVRQSKVSDCWNESSSKLGHSTRPRLGAAGCSAAGGVGAGTITGSGAGGGV